MAQDVFNSFFVGTKGISKNTKGVESYEWISTYQNSCSQEFLKTSPIRPSSVSAYVLKEYLQSRKAVRRSLEEWLGGKIQRITRKKL